MKKINATCAVFMMVAALIGCGEDEYSTVQSTVIEEEAKVNSEKARIETEEEIASRAKQQVEIAKAKAEAQKMYENSEMVMNGEVGEVGVASTTRKDILIPAYVYFPKNYNAEESYPMVVMFAGFSSDHDNGTGFIDVTREMNKNGIVVVQYDNPGYGKSSETNLAYTFENVKNDALDVINYVKGNYNIGKVGAFGYDVGGRIVMELQVEKLYDFDQIELLGPYCETSDFIQECFGDKNWDELKAEAKDNGWVKYADQEYSYQWFTGWETNDANLTDDFCKEYKNKRLMLVYSIKDDCVNPLTMQKIFRQTGAAAIELTSTGHDLGVWRPESPKETAQIVIDQSAGFMKDLIDS